MNFKRLKLKTKTFFILSIIFFAMFTLVGCNNKVLPNAIISRDDYLIGGNISFVYNKENGNIFLGGEDEVIQFYQSDLAKGWESDGCRVGLKIISPCKVEDVNNIKIKLDGEILRDDGLFSIVNDEKIAQINLYPLVSNEKKDLSLEIKWTSTSKTQCYNIIIKDGTRFMQG